MYEKVLHIACTTCTNNVHVTVMDSHRELKCHKKCVMLNKGWDMNRNGTRVRLKWTNQVYLVGRMVWSGWYWWFDKLYFNGKFSSCQKLCWNYPSNRMYLMQTEMARKREWNWGTRWLNDWIFIVHTKCSGSSKHIESERCHWVIWCNSQNRPLRLLCAWNNAMLMKCIRLAHYDGNTNRYPFKS